MFSPSFNAMNHLPFIFPVGYVFPVNVPVPLFQLPDQIAFRNLSISKQLGFTHIIR
ncbi:hypothetical protein JCM10512_3267 [Bacteroides reticulotermitis JCM 10512]|uniref:Uncharacterized protein n=1 Tax=Bacteroides reticulotermitis JCM 10512 TaxID=1445607 RepID=W4UUG9_9BACE|nr:hypothetical protein JCM10512_3267 [Bacteroides reticulotermitis JCM 10512]